MYKQKNLLTQTLWLVLFWISLTVTCTYATCPAPERAMLRPNTSAGPTEVSVGLYVLDISKVDDIAQSFQVDFMTDVLWRDERLGAVSRAQGGPCVFKMEDIWDPGLTFLNRRKSELFFPRTVTVETDGTVLYMQRFHGSIASPLDLRSFPYDEQVLTVILGSYYSRDEVLLSLDPKRTGASENFSLAGWEVVEASTRSDQRKLSVQQASVQAVISLSSYSFSVKRNINYYLWKVALPITVISCMSWAVFWINRRELGATLAVSSTAMQTLIAFMLSLREIQPPVSYLTHMDYFLYGSLSLLFLTHFAGLLSRGLTMKEKEPTAQRIDTTARWLVPLAFISLILWYLFGA